MKKRISQIVFASAIVLGMIVPIEDAKSQPGTGFCARKGLYTYYQGEVIFLCGVDGNINCLMPCPPQ